MAYKSIKDGAPVDIKEQSQSGDLIKVANSTFEIHRQISQANPQTGVYEQSDNGLQGGFVKGKRARPTEIIWLPLQWHETGRTSKLALWDNGPGMNHHELEIYTDISISGKNQSTDENFGRGEPISCLGHNPLGLIWISCTDGNVNMVKMIGEKGKNGQYRYMREYVYENAEKDDYTKSQTVLRLVDKASGYVSDEFELLENQYPKLFDTSRNWTLKVNLGHKAEQNTCVNPFNGYSNTETTAPKNWLPKSLLLRYWDMNQPFSDDNEPKVYFYEGTHTKSGTLLFKSYLESLTAQTSTRPEIAKHSVEKVTTPKGDIKIHYVYDGKAEYLDNTSVPEDHPDYKKDITKKQATHSSGMKVDWRKWCGVIYKGKMYSLRLDSSHTYAMKYFGIPANQEDFKIMVELPDDFPVYSDGDREVIKYEQQIADPDKSWQKVEITDFGNEVVENMPDWFQKLVDDASNSLDTMDKIQTEIDKYFRQLLSSRTKDGQGSVEKERRRKKTPRTKTTPVVHNDDNETKTRTPRQKRKKPIGNADDFDTSLKTPRIIPLTSVSLVKEQELQDFAAQYVQEAKGPGYIYVNLLYPQLQTFVDEIQSGLELGKLNEDSSKKILDELTSEVREDYIMLICKSIIRGLWHKNKGKWDNESVDKAMTPEALSLMSEQLFDERKVPGKTKRFNEKIKLIGNSPTSKFDQEKWKKAGVSLPEEELANA